MNTSEPPKKRPGRAPGRYLKFPRQHAVRFTEAGWTALRDLAARWGVSEAEAVRRAVALAAQDSSPDSVSGP